MKLKSSLAIALLTVLSSHQGNLLAQSCVNCWINPQTGQQESLDYLIPRQAPINEPPPVVSESSPPQEEAEKKEEDSPVTEPDKKDDSSAEPDNPPVFDDPIDRIEEDPQPLPRTQVDPRLRYEQQERNNQ